ncbi:MAG: hypothetical protein RIB59_04325, partial [Rhodospirillales bacterium]
GKETLEQEARESIEKLVDFLKVPNIHYIRGYEQGTPGGLLLSPISANQLAKLGWSKEKIKNHLWEHSAIPQADVIRTGLRQWIEADTHPDTVKTASLDPWPICRKPENLILLVAGGDHPTHNFWFQGNSRRVVGRQIELPKSWHDLLAEADRDLGCASEICLI